MSKEVERKRWMVFSAWVALLTFATFIGFFLLRLFANPADVKGNIFLNALSGALAFGILPLLAQWLVVRAVLPRSNWWLMASFAGLLAAIAISLAVEQLTANLVLPASTIALAMIYGGALGAAQWIYLRNYVRGAAWWVIACAIAWALATVTTGEAIEGTAEELLYALVPAVTTGAALVYLLGRTKEALPRPTQIAA
jgi:hypothetical protein